MIVTEYDAKLKELVKFYPYYNSAFMEGLKCIKFENRLCPKIKQGTGYRKIHWFQMLVNKCMIYDEDFRAHFAHYKSVSETK